MSAVGKCAGIAIKKPLCGGLAILAMYDIVLAFISVTSGWSTRISVSEIVVNLVIYFFPHTEVELWYKSTFINTLRVHKHLAVQGVRKENSRGRKQIKRTPKVLHLNKHDFEQTVEEFTNLQLIQGKHCVAAAAAAAWKIWAEICYITQLFKKKKIFIEHIKTLSKGYFWLKFSWRD